MIKRLKYIILALMIIPLFIININANENENNNRAKMSTEVIDYSIPIRDNSLKPYKSNIPDGWYSDTLGYVEGMDITDGKSGLDLISLDGQNNYNLEELPIINLRVGETFGFYVEAGYDGYSSQIYDRISFEYVANHANLVVTQEYEGTNYELFNSVNTPTEYSFYSDNSDLKYVKPILLEYDENTNATGATINEGYRLAKFEFSGVSTGFSRITLSTNELSRGIYNKAELLIHVYEYEGQELNYSDATISVDPTGYEGIPITLGETKDVLIPNTGEKIYFLNEASAITSSADEKFDYSYNLFSNNENISLKSNDGSIEIQYLEAEEYDINYTLAVSFTIPIAYIVENDAVTGYEYKTITKFFVHTFRLKIYDEFDIEISNSIKENNIYKVMINTNTTFSVLNQPESLVVRYIINDEEINGSYLFDKEGIYQLNVDFYDTQNYLQYHKTYIINVVSEANYYSRIEFDISNITVTLEDLSLSPYLITMTNYNDISKYADIRIEGSSGIIYNRNDNIIEVTNAQLGLSKITVIANYSNKSVESIINFSVVNKYLYALENSNIELDINTSKEIKIGYLADGNFMSLNDNISYMIQAVVFSDNISVNTNEVNNSIIITAGNKVGNYNGSVVLTINDSLYTISFKVKVIDQDIAIDGQISFNEGDSFKLLLTDDSSIKLTLDSIIVGRGYDFTFLSLNTNAVKIEKIDEYSVLAYAVGAGTSEILAICQEENGTCITAKATIVVLKEAPNITIDIEAINNTAALTIYDLLNVKINTNGFVFSQNLDIEWYLDDVRIYEALDLNGNKYNISTNSLEIFIKLTEGLHSFKIILNDENYDLNIEASKDINISPLEYQERKIEFEYDELYLISNHDNFRLNAFLDGISDNNYEYLWIIDDLKVATIEMSSYGSCIIKPIKSGETYINVFVNIGKYEDKIIRAQAKIIVEDLNTIELKLQNEFNKPGNDVIIDVLINNKSSFLNANLDIEITNGNELIEYEYSNNQIIIRTAVAGEFRASADLNNMSSNIEFNVTNFNLKQFIIIILPYLIIGLILAILVLLFVKKNNNPYKKLNNCIKKLEEIIDKGIESANSFNEAQTISYYNKLLKSTKNLINTLQYYYDEGIDEFIHILNNASGLAKVLDALIKSSKTNNTKPAIVLKNLRNKQIKDIIDNVNEVISSKMKYQEAIEKENINDNIKKKSNKRKKDDINYHEYLISKGIIQFDDEISDESSED